MKTQDVQRRLDRISELAPIDDEHAHVVEDTLYISVLEYIADGGRGVRELAALALKARDIKFARWYA